MAAIEWILLAAVMFASWWLLGPTHKGAPRAPFAYVLYLLATDHSNLWMRIYRKYGPVAVVRVPMFRDVTLVMGSESSPAYHSSKTLDVDKGAKIILGDFMPSPKVEAGVAIIPRMTAKMMSSPTFMQDADKFSRDLLRESPWDSEQVDDLFHEIWHLVFRLIMEIFWGIEGEDRDWFINNFRDVDPELLMQKPRAFYDRRGVVAETQRNFERWAAKLEPILAKQTSDRDAGRPVKGHMVWVAEEFCRTEDGIIDTYSVMYQVWGLIMVSLINTYANLAWILTRVAADPSLAENTLQEQRTIYGAEERRDSFETFVLSSKDLNEMRYVERTITENLRIAGETFASFRLAETDIAFSGHNITTGSFLVFPHSTLNKNPDLHPDPLKYNPDRSVPFSGADGGKNQTTPKMVKFGEGGLHSNFNMPVWGVGRHPCTGAKFAITIIKIISSIIIRKYDLQLVEGTWPKMPVFSLGVAKPTNKVGIKLKRRSNDA
ncbi:cytochrome P450 [Gonapodya prolifera JEL478]|uniref:Cytochrome P450 n=1 Tax=Gonapodya prolifera (strain JEL478) TaxID=1344416 RepID=A0A139B0D3_GONPJ|nr:cytochrome P450 [Gonapodya prolifera JEL478]|eukprot:KXS22400.1 cytochrome P450 [Gonapodya prolifera JEL478]